MEFDYLNAFYSAQQDENHLIEGIDSLLNTYPKLQAKVFPCYISSGFFEALPEREGFKLIWRNANVSLFEYSRTIKSKLNPHTLEGKFFTISSLSHKDIYSVITLENSDFFSRALLSFFSSQHPRVSLTFVTHKRLQNLLVNFRDKNSLQDFKIIRTSMKSRVEKKVFSSVNWPTFSLEKAFEWVKDENGWFVTLTFETRRLSSQRFTVSVSREGIIKASCFFGIVYSDFIIPISKTVFENTAFFGRRARLENDGEIKPLCINYQYEHFKSVEDNKRFIEAMKKLKAASVSVIHGNPYVQISLFDYYDGSSYDLWVLSSDKIIIVPQLKSSFQAIKRLINHIFDNYYEGSIEEYSYSNG